MFRFPRSETQDLPAKPLPFALRLLGPQSRKVWALFLACLLGSACEGAQPYSIKLLIDASSQASSSNIAAGILGAGLFFLMLRILVPLGWWIYSTIWASLAQNLETEIRDKLLRHILGHPYIWFLDGFSGRTGQRIDNAARHFLEGLDQVMGRMLYISIRSLTILVLLLSIDPWLGLGMLAWAATYIPVSIHWTDRTEKQGFLWVSACGRHAARLVDVASNIFSVRTTGSAPAKEQAACRHLAEDVANAHATMSLVWRSGDLVRTWVNTGLYALLFIIGYWRWQVGAIGIGGYAMAVSAGIGAVDSLGDFSKTLQKIFEHLGSLRESLEGLIQHRDPKPTAPPLRLDQGEITFEGVTFSYRPDAPIFQDLDLTIRAGEKVALVGASGAGKSTLVSLLLGLWQPQGGRIRIDGQDIATKDRDSVLAHMAVIPQDTSLFHRSLYDNIAYGRDDADIGDVIAAADAANIHAFIASLPDGYDTVVGERGLKLSGGQRQRIAVARAFLRAAPILLLDEATSALDSESERAIQRALHELMPGKTVLAIAHRLSTIAHMDRIIVLDQGRVVEEGTHVELLQKGGRYARLWAMQSGGYLPDPDPALLRT
jgi:ABC-type multidrug transport system fused ATPase/permease subunit